ncbi:MAG: Na/Pi cotransporter family protein [Eubacterium sp.]|nr:Na/Pi cotransporter family protein [Eubacterium sp.]
MDVISILKLLGGVGLFLFGMNFMSSSLEKVAGSGMERVLEKVTTGRNKAVGRFKGWFFGTAITAIIQSSAAVTIMVSGLVNAGIMNLGQALPVVFGSNVGSTATAQILRLGDLGSDTLILELLKPSSFAPMLVGVGAFIRLFTRKKRAKEAAGIFIGLGMLFYGMTMMEEVFEPFREDAEFQKLFTSFENPFLGLLIGLAITAVIQSSNAAVGILQALSATGTITYAITIPIVVGINLGKCTPIVISMLGSDKKARKVSWSYLLFNIFGAFFFMVLIYSLNAMFGLSWLSDPVNRGSIATVHLLFNLVTSILLLFMTDKMTRLSDRLGGMEEKKESAKELAKLDNMLLNTPTIALEQCKNLIHRMTEAIKENYRTATQMIYEYDESAFPKLEENEDFLDQCETELSAYIVRIDQRRLTQDDKLVVTEILNSISDLERIGDYCIKIAHVAREKNEQGIHFSPYGHREVDTIVKAVEYTMETCFSAFMNDDESLAVRVEPLSETIDKLKELIKSHHVERLQSGICSIQGGVHLFDLINSFERISSHSANVALHVIKRVSADRSFDEMHGHANDSFSEEYKAMYHYYTSLYVDPILKPMTKEEIAALEQDAVRRDSGRNEEKNEVISSTGPDREEGENTSASGDRMKAEKEKEKADKAKAEKIEKAKADKAKAEKAKADKAKAEKEKADKAKAEKEKADKAKADKAKAEKAKADKAKADKAKAEKAKADKAKADKAKAEKVKADKAKADKAKADKAKAEKAKAEKAKADKAKVEKTDADRSDGKKKQ